ncbi:peptidyl-tRNA hydrolase [Amylostereum chailletii]|nr:peptidyl-tRNA hydrolase [Amylostereum chailletii]
MSARILIAGLGNLPLPLTRHSVGHFVVDSLATRLGVKLSSKFGGSYGQTNILVDGSPLTLSLYKPNALMNISGPSVAKAMQASSSSPSALVIIHDSLDHIPATLSPKFGGSANGHNGVRSVIAAVKTDEFHRLRIGIGRPSSGVADYVLGRLSSFERQHWSPDGPGLDAVWEKVEDIARKVARSR